ncbi:hypothetical protein [Rhodococcus sp. NPDC127528]|uniref:hypothetical protein n=1 Tax=unclassified Rhodococcus (in: high G+C Gram-positive bacteria) TaxID=192944 RepID=UPI00363014D9
MTDGSQQDTEAADRIAALVLAVPGVADLHGGMFGEVATYLPGRRLLGVALTEESCAVHITVTYPANVVDVAEAVRRAVTPAVAVPVNVTVEDVQLERTAQ